MGIQFGKITLDGPVKEFDRIGFFIIVQLHPFEQFLKGQLLLDHIGLFCVCKICPCHPKKADKHKRETETIDS